MRFLLLLLILCGCSTKEPVKTASPNATGDELKERLDSLKSTVSDNSILFDARSIVSESEDVLDAIFENEWQQSDDDASRQALANSSNELRKRLAVLDDRLKPMLASLKDRRARDESLKDESAHEALLLRQKITSLESKLVAADKLLVTINNAAKAAIAENNKGDSFNGLREKANDELTEKVRSAEQQVAGVRLELEKAKRMIRLYE